MSTFDHPGLMQDINECLVPFRKSQPDGFHVKALIKLGATRAELEEMLAVCVYMGGGPALMYAAEAVKAWDDLQAGQA